MKGINIEIPTYMSYNFFVAMFTARLRFGSVINQNKVSQIKTTPLVAIALTAVLASIPGSVPIFDPQTNYRHDLRLDFLRKKNLDKLL
jgi:hypothetical protein